jgi:hypothetical protein
MAKFPLLGLLGLLFIALKLTNFIAWSWWWVLAPFWAPTFLILFIVALYSIPTKEGKR